MTREKTTGDVRSGSSSGITLSLVVPTYNEARNIKRLIEILTALLAPRLKDRYELIIVDDNSPDGTSAVVDALLPSYPGLRLLTRKNEKGLSSAVVAGWRIARGELLGVIDGDLQHPPEVIPKLVDLMLNRADLDAAIASRHTHEGGVGNWNLFRRIASRGAQILGLLIVPEILGKVSDPMSGCFVVRKDKLDLDAIRPIGYKILLEVIAQPGIRHIAETGYVFQLRSEGESKVSAKIYLEFIRQLWSLRIRNWPFYRRRG